MWDERVNDAIDEVARQTTEGEPGDAATFRRRVLARIEGKDVRRSTFDVRRSTFGVPRWVMIPVAGAALALAVFVMRAPQPEKAHAPDTVRAAAPPVPVLEPRPPEQPRPSPTLARVPAGRRLEGSAIASPDPQIQPNDVASIAVAPLVVDAVSPESIQLERLDPIAPIAVAPLDINDSSRRNP